jgi:hypothetical protein
MSNRNRERTVLRRRFAYAKAGVSLRAARYGET